MHEPAFFPLKGWGEKRREEKKKINCNLKKNPCRNAGWEGASVPGRRVSAALQQLMSWRDSAPCAKFLRLWKRFVLER